MRDDGRTADYRTVIGNDTAPERVGEDPWSWQRWHFGSPSKDLCLLMPSVRSRSHGGRGASAAERTESCRARGLATTRTFTLL